MASPITPSPEHVRLCDTLINQVCEITGPGYGIHIALIDLSNGNTSFLPNLDVDERIAVLEVDLEVQRENKRREENATQRNAMRDLRSLFRL